MSTKARRRFRPEQKAKILKRHLFGKEPISDLCDEFHLQPSVVYSWQRQLQMNMSAALEQVAPVDRVASCRSRVRISNGWFL